MAKKVAAVAKVQTSKPSLAELLKQKAENANSLRVSISIDHILNFDPENPVAETMLILGSPRKVVKWDVLIDGKKAVATFMVGQISRLYQSIAQENTPEGVSLSDNENAVVILTDKFTINSRNQKSLNGSAGFLNLTPYTVKSSVNQEAVTGFQYQD